MSLTKAPGGNDFGEGSLPPVHRTCEGCGRQGIRLPLCGVCQRDLGNVYSFRPGRGVTEGRTSVSSSARISPSPNACSGIVSLATLSTKETD